MGTHQSTNDVYINIYIIYFRVRANFYPVCIEVQTWKKNGKNETHKEWLSDTYILTGNI